MKFFADLFMATLLACAFPLVHAGNLSEECRIRVLWRAQIEQWEQMIREVVPKVYVDEGPWAAAELHEDLKNRIKAIEKRMGGK